MIERAIRDGEVTTMASVDLRLYVRGFNDASTRFAGSSPNWEPGFHALFEAVMWAASIRDHLRVQGSGYLSACPHLESLYFVRNLVGHVLPAIGGGEPPYLTEAISSHGASLAASISVLRPGRDPLHRYGSSGLLHETWSGVPERATVLSRLGDTPEWRWRPRGEWSGTPRSPHGQDEYDDHLDGEPVASALGIVAAYLDGL